MMSSPSTFTSKVSIGATAGGAVTPPVGATTYVVGGMAKDIPLEWVFRGVAYFIPAYIICILLLMCFPGLVTYLPSLLRAHP